MRKSQEKIGWRGQESRARVREPAVAETLGRRSGGKDFRMLGCVCDAFIYSIFLCFVMHSFKTLNPSPKESHKKYFCDCFIFWPLTVICRGAPTGPCGKLCMVTTVSPLSISSSRSKQSPHHIPLYTQILGEDTQTFTEVFKTQPHPVTYGLASK